jgi:hypothetical protein
VAIVAVAVPLFAEWRAGIRIADERLRSVGVLAAQQKLHDKEIGEKRALADQRLTRQLEHGAAQLAAERKAAEERLKAQLEHSYAQLKEERQNAQDAEQLTEAWALEVVGAQRGPEPGITSEPDQPIGRPVVIVINHGRYTITRVEARFSPEGQSTIGHSVTQPFADSGSLPHTLARNLTGTIGDVYVGVVSPGRAMRFLGATVLDRTLRTTYAMVRWTDRCNQR